MHLAIAYLLVVLPADPPDVAELKKQLKEAEAKVTELKIKLAAADNPKMPPNGRILAFHTDKKGDPTRARAGDFDSYVDVRGSQAIMYTRVTLIVQVFRWNREKIKATDIRAVAGVTIETDTGVKLELEKKPDGEDGPTVSQLGFREAIHINIPIGVRYIDVDIPNTMVGGKGETFKWRVLAEKWLPAKK